MLLLYSYGFANIVSDCQIWLFGRKFYLGVLLIFHLRIFDSSELKA